jgi:hypothetical protein
MRRHDAELRGLVAAVVRRVWTSAVQRRVWVTAFVITWCFFALSLTCAGVSIYHDFEKHEVVPWKHRAERIDGQPGYFHRGRTPEERIWTPITEEEFQVFEENDAAGLTWGRRGAVCWIPVVVLMLLVLRPWNARRANPGPGDRVLEGVAHPGSNRDVIQ